MEDVAHLYKALKFKGFVLIAVNLWILRKLKFQIYLRFREKALLINYLNSAIIPYPIKER
jgi:hypothetical protein